MPADLLRRSGHDTEAIDAYRRAIELTTADAVRHFLEQMQRSIR